MPSCYPHKAFAEDVIGCRKCPPDKWHIFYYHSPNPDAEGDFSDIGGKFVKQQIVENEDEHLVYQRFAVKEKEIDTRGYCFIPPTCSAVYIAYSAYEWSTYLLDELAGNDILRADHMQKSGTMLEDDAPCSLPLQFFQDNKPTPDNLEHGESSDFKTTLSKLVQELDPKAKEENKVAGNSTILEKLILSATPAVPYTKAKIDQIFNETKNKIEVGKVVVLHDPIGISQDFGALHAAISVAHADDIMENQYAYLTYQAIETQLGNALPHIDSPFSNKIYGARQTLIDFDNKVQHRQTKNQSTPLLKRHKSDTALVQIKSEMTDQEQKELKEAWKVVKVNAPTEDQEAAVKALNKKFKSTREEIAKNTNIIEQAITKVVNYAKIWNTEKTGSGSVVSYLNLRGLEMQTTDLLDTLRPTTNTLYSCFSITSGFESSKKGKAFIDKVIFASDTEDADYRYEIAVIAKVLASLILDKSSVLDALLGEQYFNMNKAKTVVKLATNKFVQTLVNSPKSAQNFAKEVRKFALDNPRASKHKVRQFLVDIGRIHGKTITIKKNPFKKFLEAIASQSNELSAWDNNFLVKTYGELYKENISVLTIDEQPHFDLPKATLQSLGAIGFASVVFGMYVSEPDLKKLQSKYSREAADIAGLSELYFTLVLAEVGAFALNRNADDIAAKYAAKALQKLKIPTKLSLSTNSGISNAAPKTLAAVKGVLKITPIVGAIDGLTNYYQLMAYSERSDSDAALFAGVSITGGALLFISGFLNGLAEIGFVVKRAGYVGMAGVLMAALGMVGKLFAEDGELETWVANGFWGWKLDFLGDPSKYLYWENMQRGNISFEKIDKTREKGFKAQLLIAKLASIDEEEALTHGIAISPKVSSQSVKQFMHREMSDYYYQIYQPQFSKKDGYIIVSLPSYTALSSIIEVSYSTEEGGYIGGQFTRYQPRRQVAHTYTYPGENLDAWQRTGHPEILHFKPLKQSVSDIKELTFKYYPKGREHSIEVKGEKSFGLFN